jgi:hypothetical protein
MEDRAIDLRKKESQIRIVTKRGEIDHRIATTRVRFMHAFWGRPPMRTLGAGQNLWEMTLPVPANAVLLAVIAAVAFHDPWGAWHCPALRQRGATR